MRYEFKLTGQTPLLMHFDDVLWADEVDAWRLDAANTKKKGEKSGDDRRPAWTWTGYCYFDREGNITIPGANLTACFKKAGARVPYKGQQTFKEIAVSGIFIEQEFLNFANKGEPVAAKVVKNLRDVSDFHKHVDVVRKAGFDLDVRRAPIGAAKHVRVRPKFEQWTLAGTLDVLDDRISDEVLDAVFYQAGRCGLGDWRPASPKSPGIHGMFEHELKPIK